MIMLYSDYHMHTNFSSDSETEMEAMIQKSIQLGLKEIAITDHIDYDYPDQNYPFLFEYESYAKQVHAFQEKYQDKISILLGVEFGLQTSVKDKIDDFCKNHFDFIIGSTHTVEGLELYHDYFYKGKTQSEAYRIYFEDLLENVKLFDGFHVYGHLDYINRYGHYDNRDLNYHDYAEIIDEILKVLIAKGKGIELNTSGFKYGLGYAHPKFEILCRYKELGGEIITIGSDAHEPEHIGFHFKDAYDILKAAGFKAFTTFKNQQPHWIDIP